MQVGLATSNFYKFQKHCAEHPQILALIDASFPRHRVACLAQEFRSNQASSRLVVIDRHYSSFRAEQAQSIGALYCTRDIQLANLSQILIRVLQSRDVVQSEIDSLIKTCDTIRVDMAHLSKLTSREIDVWSLIGEGLSVADCARKLGVSESTADNHKSRLMKKLQVSKSLELVRLAIKTGLVDV